MSDNELNFVAGAGSVYLAALGADGLPDDDGFRYVGNVESININLTTERLVAWTSDDQIRQKAIDVPTSVDRGGAMVIDEPDEDNLGLFFFGDTGTYNQSNTPVTDEAVTASAKGGRWYQLGVTAANPAGVRDVSSVTLDDGDTTTYDAGDDYELDAEMGRFYVVPGGAMVGENVEADYTPADSDYQQVQTREDDNPEFVLLYKENARAGLDRDMTLHRCKISPDGDFSLKDAESHQQIPLQIDVLVPEIDAPAMTIRRRVAD